MAFVIEPFTLRHRDAVPELILGVQVGEFGVSVTRADQPDLEDIPGFYQQGKGQFWVALEGSRVVGTIGLKQYADDAVALRKMFVARDFRGPVGTGQALLDGAIEHCRQNGIRQIVLGTVEKLKAAHRFYEKNGFEHVPAEELPKGFPRMAVDTMFFWRSVSGGAGALDCARLRSRRAGRGRRQTERR